LAVSQANPRTPEPRTSEPHRRRSIDRRQVERRRPPAAPQNHETFNRRFDDTLQLVAGGNDLLEVTYRCLRLATDLTRIYRAKRQPFELADFPLDDPVIQDLRRQADNLEVFLKIQIEEICRESRGREQSG